MRLIGETRCRRGIADRVALSDHACRQANASLPLIGVWRHAGRAVKGAK
jgi:hypothetical protein